MRGLLFVSCFIGLTCFAADKSLPFFDDKEMTPYWSSAQLHPAHVSEFKAVDQNGKPVSDASMKGQVTLVNFFFVKCPGVCPGMMKEVQKIQKSVIQEIKDVQIYSFSVMPETDTPDKLREYSKTYGIDGKSWMLLTGNKSDIYHVGKDMFKADGAVGKQKSKDSFIHTQNIYLVDKDLRIRGIYNTSDAEEMKHLKADIKNLM